MRSFVHDQLSSYIGQYGLNIVLQYYTHSYTCLTHFQVNFKAHLPSLNMFMCTSTLEVIGTDLGDRCHFLSTTTEFELENKMKGQTRLIPKLFKISSWLLGLKDNNSIHRTLFQWHGSPKKGISCEIWTGPLKECGP